MRPLETRPGRAFPLGATATAEGVNFSVYSKHAAALELLLFDQPADAAPAHVLRLDRDANHTDGYWHVELPGLGSGQLYGYRAAGPGGPPAAQGLRFDRQKLLVDPYALAVANTENYRRDKAAAPGDNAAWAFKCVVVDPAAYDWEGDAPLKRPPVDALIYEMHVAGFTRHPSSGLPAERRGTYAGVIDKIPYLRELGILTVELMPVQQFDPQAAPVLTNYWGYQPVAWFAPHRDYSARRDLLGPLDELRDLVKALHRAGIEVILDVVFNHTAEGGAGGPLLSLAGLDNPTYYLLDPADGETYLDETGCGNTVNANDPVVRRMILDCLRYWVEQVHVDGFRFDLAASLSRGVDGRRLSRPPLLLDIDADPVLAGIKIIAEPWDAGGLYELADFAGDRWAVWNGRFRDNVRRFVKGDRGSVGPLADCLLAGNSLFHERGRNPNRSVNFVTSHDGFTLCDLVSYNRKHNEANGLENRDGTDDNASWNCGVEGPSNDPRVVALRRRQIKNFLTILLFAEGRPMLLMGDEVCRTQQGNNNGYCQDNAISWFDWDDCRRHADLLRFVRSLIAFHQGSPCFRDRSFWSTPGATQVTWHGVRLGRPQWDADSHALAVELLHPGGGEHLQVLLNAYWGRLDFELPPTTPRRAWHRLVDTARDAPDDFCDPPAPLPPSAASYSCEARSSVVLIERPASLSPSPGANPT